jgi:AcrR family transcriptional regulator
MRPVARLGRWGDATPESDDEARDLLLRAAARAYAARGPSRTTIDDVAAEASVHRTTVYKYFPNRDALLGSVLLWENEQVLAEARRYLRKPGSLADRMVPGYAHFVRGVRDSSLLRHLITRESADLFVRATSAADETVRLTAKVLAPMVAEAAKNGELREDLDPTEVVSWLVRSMLMLLVESLWDEQRDPVDEFRRFILPGVSSCQGRSG